ncbi:hypothetical protein PR202_gb01076 [Eleusine coracana subsp. coracana]|uniref:Uncharacterized protein n=1 Tax=Eleusine coracana subsp. coracana TaxID=191504 RepID=A0AAV5DWI4_ELECO|nr:hypothetical protein PR202_gb01076 [Eleusine coracana subsp. coracana]
MLRPSALHSCCRLCPSVPAPPLSARVASILSHVFASVLGGHNSRRDGKKVVQAQQRLAGEQATDARPCPLLWCPLPLHPSLSRRTTSMEARCPASTSTSLPRPPPAPRRR